MSRQYNKKKNIPNDMINIHALFKTHHIKQTNRLNIYHKTLNRVQRKIKLVSKLYDKKETFYVIPEYQFGIPLYNQITCICYIIAQLRKNGFTVGYTHPNFLWISWKLYVNKYQYNITTPPPKKDNPEYEFVDKRKQTKNIKKHFKNLNEQLIAQNNVDNTAELITDNNSHNYNSKYVNKSVLDRLTHRASLLQKFN